MTTGIFRLAVAAVALGVATSPLNAAFLVVTNDRGRLDSFGNTITNGVYLTGLNGGTTFRSYFAFDLSSVSGSVASGTFEAKNPLGETPSGNGYAGDSGGETLNLYDVTSTLTALTGGPNAAAAAAYTDLGTGTVFGTKTVKSSDNGTVVSVTLNPLGISALNAARTSSNKIFILGGSVSPFSSPSNHYIFGSTSTAAGDITQLNLTLDAAPPTLATPLPPTLLAGFLGMAMLAGVRRFRKA